MSEKAAAGAGKDVIYIDVDDEITGIIDKVRGSHNKIVALVLPKRATMLQSVVNMKLLKRGADEAKKNLVLITSEAGLLPLAGNVGLYVAKSLQSKPEVPDGPGAGGHADRSSDRQEAVDEDDTPDTVDAADEKPLDKTAPVGVLAGSAALDDTIEMDDEDETASLAEADEDGVKTGKKAKDKKKFSIPNFNRFRLLLVLGGVGLIALIVFGYLAAVVLPKASIVIKTDSQNVASSVVLTLKTGDSAKLDVPSGTIPATAKQVQKTLNQSVDATGQQNNGATAGGSVAVKNCSDSAVSLPQGTGLSSNGLTYLTQEALTLGPGNFDSHGNCKSNTPTASVDIQAQQPGAKYNQAAGASFAIAAGVTGVGADITGGTDNITKIVTQADIDNATQKISQQDSTGIKQELTTDLTNVGSLPIAETFNAGAPQTKSDVAANAAADKVTVTQTITYTMFGVKQADLQQIIANDVNKHIDPTKQSILDYGLSSAQYGIQQQPTDSGATLTLQTNVIAGPDLKTDAIKKQIAGKKSGDAIAALKQNPGVTDATVSYSPFWVSSIPKNTGKITVTIEKPSKTVNSSDANAGN